MVANNRLKADVWTCAGDLSQFELLSMRVYTQTHSMFVDVLYHPPRQQYQPAALLDYIEESNGDV